MSYVVTDACTKDFRCVDECSVDAIAPHANDPQAGTVSQVYINPELCIDCGSCIAVCEFDAISAVDDLPAEKAHFAEKNAAYFQ